jgi:ribokinase
VDIAADRRGDLGDDVAVTSVDAGPDDLQVAVVGHVEWVRFVRAHALPVPGEILRAAAHWGAPAGGGAMAAFEMARLGVHTHFFTAHGDDPVGKKVRAALDGSALEVHASARVHTPHPEVFTYLTADHERTITVLEAPLGPRGSDPLPWTKLRDCAGAYFCKGDADALREARSARVLVATARALPVLAQARVRIDALVASAKDSGERYQPGELDPEPGVVVLTAGAAGGTWFRNDGTHGRFTTPSPPGPLQDSYGAGDSFAGAITVALARGLPLDDALAFAARSGAAALTRVGAG